MRRHPFLAAAVGVLVLLVAGLVFLLVFDFKGVFERRASAALGQPVTVASARLKIFPLRVILEDLNVGDPAPKDMMHARHIDATIGFWRLFAGDVVFRRLAVEDAKTVLARDANGDLNWTAKDD